MPVFHERMWIILKKVRFVRDGKKDVCVDVMEQTTILAAAGQAGVLIDASCHGKGICGKCRVLLDREAAGKVSDCSDTEKHLLSEKEREQGWRLACEARILGDMSVSIPKIHSGTDRKKNMGRLPDGFVCSPTAEKLCVKVRRPKMSDQRSDLERLDEEIRKALQQKITGEENLKTESVEIRIDNSLLTKLHEAVMKERGKVTVTLWDRTIIAVEAGDTAEMVYGLAVDVGTTTVVCMLWNLQNGECIDVEARTNPQSLYGADVISRIQYTKEGKDHLRILQDKIIGCVNEMIGEMAERNAVDKTNIYDCCVVGNTTMSHLFFGVNPESLARTPFAPVFCRSIIAKAEELGIDICPLARVQFLPNIAGHVGADITALLLAADLVNREGNVLAIDIGTNGEVVCAKDGKLLACSTAAGPAFEGAGIRCGMRAAPGAIEKAWIEEGHLKISVIDQEKPIGICGSGVIDLIAALRRAGLINDKGRMLEREEALTLGIPESLADGLRKTETGMEFTVWKEEDEEIILSQNDIREIQLTKGAMLAGMKTLMKIAGIDEKSLDCLLIAGAFGNYIDKNSALEIRMLPAVDPEKIISIGNSAGTGACMALLNRNYRRNAEIWVKQVEHVELSVNMDFQEEYMLAMNF